MTPEPPFSFAEYLTVMSRYKADPELVALRAEFKQAQASGRGLPIARENILAFVKRKLAAAEAFK